MATTCHSSRTHLSDSACKPTEVLSQREISLHDLGKPWKTLSNDLECGKNAFLTSPAPDLISIYFSTLVHLSKSTKLLALNDVSSQARARQTKNSPPASTFQSTGKIRRKTTSTRRPFTSSCTSCVRLVSMHLVQQGNALSPGPTTHHLDQRRLDGFLRWICLHL